MGSQAKNNSSFRFEIDNFSEKKAVISSPVFVSHGCEWYFDVHPKGDSICYDHLGLFLYVTNPKSLGREWERKTCFQFVLLNQSDEELYRSGLTKQTRFCANFPSWGFRKALRLRKLQEKGFLKNDRLIVNVYINSVENVDGEDEVESEKKDTVKVNGFQVFSSHVTSATKLFVDHPDIAEDFKPKNEVVKTEYMNVLLNLVETLNKPSQNQSETELSNSHRDLSELMEQGFKLEWLKSKLDEVSLVRKKSDDADGSRVQQLEERVKNLELMELDSLKTKLDKVSLEKKKADADWSRVQKLEERVKDLELTELDKLDEVSLEKKKADADWCRVQKLEERVKDLELMELDSLKTKLDEVSLDKKKAAADWSRVQKLEERVKDLEVMDSLKTKLDEVSLEKKKADADWCRVQKLEERVENLELTEVDSLKTKLWDRSRIEQLEKSNKNILMMLSDLKVDLDKKKAKSFADGFLLVDEVD